MPRIRARPMFGGVGLYSGELFFALIADDAVYFKADESTPRLRSPRNGTIRPFGDAGGTMQYYQVPEDLLEDPEALRPWAEKAVATVGAIATIPMHLGPSWYPIALTITALPCTWLGGVLYRGRQADR